MLSDFRFQVFYTLARTGSFTATARKLSITQPAVSSHITQLEAATGCRLFDRAKSGVSLTSEGVLFDKYVTRILRLYDEINDIFVDKTKAPDEPTLFKLGDRQAEISEKDGEITIRLA